jgi:hypothetical protein
MKQQPIDTLVEDELRQAAGYLLTRAARDGLPEDAEHGTILLRAVAAYRVYVALQASEAPRHARPPKQ